MRPNIDRFGKALNANIELEYGSPRAHSMSRRLHEIDQFLALEKAAPHVVALAGRDDELHGAAERGVPVVHEFRVVFERDEGVDVAVDGKERDSGFREWGELIDGVMMRKLLL